MTVDQANVVIIGGGISGTAAAYELAKRGVRATLLEQGELHSMGSGWSLAGVRQSGRHPAELPLAKAAVKRWESLSDELGADVEYRQDGNLRLALTDDDLPVIENVVRNGNASDIPMEFVAPDDVARIAPMVRTDIVGGSFCPTDGHANNHLAVRAYANAAQAGGATIRTRSAVREIVAKNGRIVAVLTSAETIPASTVIVAAGILTPALVAPLGLDLPIRIVLDPVMQTTPVAPMLKPVLGVAGGGFAARQEASGCIRFIGSASPWPGPNRPLASTMPTVAQAGEMVTQGIAMLPPLADIEVRAVWGGLIDNTPDALPVLDGATGIDGLVVAAGFSGHGFGIGPATGEILADLATSTPCRFDLQPFRLARFAEGVATAPAQLHG